MQKLLLGKKMTKNNDNKKSFIYRSIPQVMNNHLPGSVKPSNDIFYKIDKIVVSHNNLEIRDIIYNDLLNNLYNWSMFSFKDINNDLNYQISDFIITKSKKTINRNFSINSFQQINDFDENKFSVSEIVDTTEEEDYHTTSSHKGSYFPYTWKCNNCNILFYSKKRPSKNCKCSHKSWKQLNVALVSSSSKFFDLKSIGDKNKSKDSELNNDFIKCSYCPAPLKIKEAHNISQYRLECSKNKNHYNSIDYPNYTLYSLYSHSLFYPLKSEVVNFNQHDLILQKKAMLINQLILDNKLVSLDKSENIMLKKFSNFWSLYQESKGEECEAELKNDLYKTIKSIELNSNFKSIIQNITNGNNIISDDELSKYYNQQILERIEEKDMITIEQACLFPIEKIGLLRNIQVINYVYGYSRISDSPISTQTGVVKLHFFYRENNNSEYSPTSENYSDDHIKQIYFSQETNKGIYFKIKTEQLDFFIRNQFKPNNKETDITDKFIMEKKFIYLHSLCHYLIRLISQNFSGISTSSLTELIFPEDGAFLIYKKGTGKELGYLEAFFNNCILNDGDKFHDFWNEMNNKNNLSCPGDEICGGACVECLFVSKHSCKHKNEKLDRLLLLNRYQ